MDRSHADPYLEEKQVRNEEDMADKEWELSLYTGMLETFLEQTLEGNETGKECPRQRDPHLAKMVP